MEKLIIPQKLKVGMNKRGDTYTNNLGFVSYYDVTGKFRREGSWESWRDKSIEPLEFDNEPTDGFVLNENGGGGYGSYARDEFVRIWDPRGFEVEISFGNLLYILKYCSCLKGKGIEGKLVYGWPGAQAQKLILIPAEADDYQSSLLFTDLQKETLSTADLVVGMNYQFKDGNNGYYIGYDTLVSYGIPSSKKVHIFFNMANYKKYFTVADKQIATQVGNTPSNNIAQLLDGFNYGEHSMNNVEIIEAPDASPLMYFTFYPSYHFDKPVDAIKKSPILYQIVGYESHYRQYKIVATWELKEGKWIFTPKSGGWKKSTGEEKTVKIIVSKIKK